MSEAALNRKLRALVSSVEGPMLYRRIEDASGNLGTPDVFLMVGGKAMWVELKCTPTPGAKPVMRQGQAGFAAACQRAGGTAWVLVSNKKDDTVRLIDGSTTGSDWREKLVYEGPLDLTLVDAMLQGLGSKEVADLLREERRE